MKNISYISCPSCGFIMKPVWYLEKELDTHGIPTGYSDGTHTQSLQLFAL